MRDKKYIFLVPIIVILHNILFISIDFVYFSKLFEYKGLSLIGIFIMITYLILGLNTMFYWNLFKRQYSMIAKNLKRFQIINYIGVALLFVMQIPLTRKVGFEWLWLDYSDFIPLVIPIFLNSTFPLLLYLLFPIYMLLQNNINDFTKKISILSIILMTICQLLFIFNAPVIILFIYLTIVIPKMNLE
ncbi:MAG: hypothetical protein IJ213_01700 [Bacteroidales bacterium]|nr:hypothetical protein [Bacteroidales bacterium]